MSEEILIRQGAPTLAGIKTGSLFPCPCEDQGTDDGYPAAESAVDSPGALPARSTFCRGRRPLPRPADCGGSAGWVRAATSGGLWR